MSARPRLVEEGRPVTENRATAKAAATTTTTAEYSHRTHDNNITSLTSAAGHHSFQPPTKQRSKQSMRLVIGHDNDEVMDDLDGVYGPPLVSTQNYHSSHAATHQHSHAATYHTITRLVIGGEDPPMERMEGIESHDAKGPLVVMDGANIAYAYADAHSGTPGKREPDAKGIQVAANYFLAIGVRVTIVIPAPWLRGNNNHENNSEQRQVLNEFKTRGLLVEAPPRDDDDSYALTIARREQVRATQRGEGGGFVLSNDMFRDAMTRDETLGLWLKHGRISYAFVDMGNLDDFGDRILDFIPNPRHSLISWAEEKHRTIDASRF